MEELEMLLNEVSDSYDDFVGGVMNFLVDDEESREILMSYIRENPEKKTDDILEYLDELLGIEH